MEKQKIALLRSLRFGQNCKMRLTKTPQKGSFGNFTWLPLASAKFGFLFTKPTKADSLEHLPWSRQTSDGDLRVVNTQLAVCDSRNS